MLADPVDLRSCEPRFDREMDPMPSATISLAKGGATLNVATFGWGEARTHSLDPMGTAATRLDMRIAEIRYIFVLR